MKKIILTILILLLNINVKAEVVTYERTEDDLRINDWITVTPYNKNNILNTPSIDENAKIYDFADLLTNNEETILYNETINFINTYNMDLALVTINENYSTARVYADDFYDYNKFSEDGLLVLIDMDTREFYISTSGNAILMYNDYRINNILDAMTYSMQSANYYNALKISINKISNYASLGIPEENNNSYIDNNGDYIYVEDKEYPLLPILIISIIISTIVLIIFINKNKLVKKAYAANHYIEQNNKFINNLGDKFLTTHTSRIRINTDSSSGYSSSSGRSSTHRSSSGRSHGGGGRKF